MTSNSRQLTYLNHKVVFLMDKLADKVLRERLNLSLSEFRILMAIRAKSGVSQKKIAEFWEMTEAAVSRQIEILAKRKLVVKRQNRQNRRAYILDLTNQGARFFRRAFLLLDKEFQKIYKNINLRERKILTASLFKLLKVLCKND